MRKSAFGYMRIESGMPDEMIGRLRQVMADYSRDKGLDLGRIFTDYGDAGTSEFASLIDGLRADKVTMVIVPSVDHLARMESVRITLQDLIKRQTGASVVFVASGNLEGK